MHSDPHGRSDKPFERRDVRQRNAIDVRERGKTAVDAVRSKVKKSDSEGESTAA